MKKLLILGGIALSATAAAQAPSSGSAGSGGTSDPNETVCRSVRDTTSRVSRTRVCMTRAQWDQRRRGARSTNDRAPAGSPDQPRG